MFVGKIELDGLVRDRSNMMIGKFRSDGTIENRNYMMVGKIERDGTIRNRSNMMIGKVNSDGEVRDRSNMQIGDRLVEKYPNIPESTIRQEVEQKFMSLVSYVFNRMRENGN